MHDHHATYRSESLWASLSEGRTPQDGEVEKIAAKIWADAYRRDSAIGWNEVEVGSVPHRKSFAAALAALGVAPVRLVS